MKLNVELNNWIVPNYVSQKMTVGLRQDGIKEPLKFSLSELDSETLSGLCDEFRREIFRKAGKTDPKPN